MDLEAIYKDMRRRGLPEWKLLVTGREPLRLTVLKIRNRADERLAARYFGHRLPGAVLTYDRVSAPPGMTPVRTRPR